MKAPVATVRSISVSAIRRRSVTLSRQLIIDAHDGVERRDLAVARIEHVEAGLKARPKVLHRGDVARLHEQTDDPARRVAQRRALRLRLVRPADGVLDVRLARAGRRARGDRRVVERPEARPAGLRIAEHHALGHADLEIVPPDHVGRRQTERGGEGLGDVHEAVLEILDDEGRRLRRADLLEQPVNSDVLEHDASRRRAVGGRLPRPVAARGRSAWAPTGNGKRPGRRNTNRLKSPGRAARGRRRRTAP